MFIEIYLVVECPLFVKKGGGSMWKGICGIFSNISYSNIVNKTRYKKLELKKHLTLLQ